MIHESARYGGNVYRCIKFFAYHLKAFTLYFGTDCLFVTWTIVSVGEARGKVTPSQPFLRVVFSFFFVFFLTFILSDRQSLSGRCHPAAKRWRGSKTLGRSRRIIVQSKKKKKEKEKMQKKWKKCCFEQVSFGLTNKNIPVERARLPAFSWFRMSLFLRHCFSTNQDSTVALVSRLELPPTSPHPRGPGVSHSVTAATHSLYISLHGRGQFLHWTENCGELHSQSNSNGRWLHGVLWAFLFQQKKRRNKKKPKKNAKWLKLNSTDSGDEEK